MWMDYYAKKWTLFFFKYAHCISPRAKTLPAWWASLPPFQGLNATPLMLFTIIGWRIKEIFTMKWIKWKRYRPTSNSFAAKSVACYSPIRNRPQHATSCIMSAINLTYSKLPSLYSGFLVARDLIRTMLWCRGWYIQRCNLWYSDRFLSRCIISCYRKLMCLISWCARILFFFCRL